MSMYIIDDHPLVRSAIAMLLRRMRSSTKVIELDKFSELQAAIIKNGEPTLFVLDLLLPGVKGTSAVTEVKKMYPEVPLAVLSSMPAGDAGQLGWAVSALRLTFFSVFGGGVHPVGRDIWRIGLKYQGR